MDKYCNSVWYIITIGAICILCHSLNLPVTGALLLTAVTGPALLFCKNTLVHIPFAMLCSFVLSQEVLPQTGYYNSPLKITALCVCLILLIAAFIFNFTYYKKWSRLFKRTYLTVSFFFLSLSLIFGGLFSPTFTLQGLGTSISIIATMFIAYALFMGGEYEGKQTVDRFVWTLITATVAIGAAFLQLYIKNDFDISYAKAFLQLGYVGPNTGSAIITLAIPMTLYLVYKYKHGYWFMLLVALELGLIASALSRASLIVAVPGTLIVSIALCFKKKNGRLGYYIMFGLCIAAMIVVIVIFRNKIFGYLSSIFAGGFTGSGRTNLWELGWTYFKDNPIFGSGMWVLRLEGYWYYSFHCTPLTYLYCCGLVGFIAYIYHRYKTIRLVFSAKLTPERVFIALTVLAMLCNALLDIAMTSPTHLMYYAVMIALIEMDVNKVKTENTNSVKENKITTESET